MSDNDDMTSADVMSISEMHETDQADEAQLDGQDAERREPCGEGHCRCYGVGSEHIDHACGCDCPRDGDGQLIDD
ncbi:hypothetical protein OG244_28430 [Streptomyces brevispora]|uniref:hypothetical protein n=1 Tax=Streptomyces brevispora TaxID=887462 RepID=UPI002E37D0F1|nr:hypothetical protein [Streptomyces brevispora]